MTFIPTKVDLPPVLPVCITCGEYEISPVHILTHARYHAFKPKPIVNPNKFKPTPGQAKQLSQFAADMAITWCRNYLIKLGDSTKLNDGEVARLAEIFIAGYLSCALRLIPTDTDGSIFKIVSGADCETNLSKSATS